MSTALDEHTYIPEEQDNFDQVLNFLTAHENVRGDKPAPRYFLAGAEEGEQVEIPGTVYQVLLQVVEAMQEGKAVTVAPHGTRLTTQQAADILGVSRPTLVNLIKAGRIPSETPGKSRRMVKLADVLRYREERREEQYRAIMATSVDDYNQVETSDEAASDLRRIRADLAAQRRANH